MSGEGPLLPRHTGRLIGVRDWCPGGPQFAPDGLEISILHRGAEMDQHRFERTFRHIVKRLNDLSGDVKLSTELRPAPVEVERKDETNVARQRARRKEA